MVTKSKKSAVKPALPMKSVENMTYREFCRSNPEISESDAINSVPPSLLKPQPGWNKRVRDDSLEAHIDLLFQHFMAGGTVPPLFAIKGTDHLLIRDGHSRWEAATRAVEAGRTDLRLPVLQFRGDDLEALDLQFNTAKGKPQSQYEQSLLIQEYLNAGQTPDQIADRVKKSRTHIDNLMLIMNAPEESKDKLIRGDISADAFIELARAHGPRLNEVLDNLLQDSKVAPGGSPKKITRKTIAQPKFGKVLTAKISTTFAGLPAAIQSEFGDFPGDPEKVDPNKIYELKLTGEMLKSLLEISLDVQSTVNK